MSDLLLELFSEEIPARMQEDALAHLQQRLSVLSGKISGFVTPRRLAVIIKDLPATQSDITTELKGPKIGAPEAALQGFLKKNNLQQSDLVERDGVYFATVHQKGQPTSDLIKTVVEKILAEFPWPKSMRWGAGETTWVRPLHSILCLFDGKVVPVEFAGLKAGNTTRGHRFLSSGDITISSAAEYEATLEKAHVIVDRDTRKANILAQAEKAATAKKLTLKKDEGLLEEVTGLVEWPVVLTGTIDAKFMDLPKEVLVSEMRAHQKYFALENTDGSLADTFLITANMETSDGGKAIVAGNERVLRARLSDGRFFWDQDRKKSLESWTEGLKNVTFHAKLGTVADKVERIAALADTLTTYIPGADKKLVAQAAALSKADLVTGMVGEFPELQGVMGRYYAQGQKESPLVADAIHDHYLPLGPSSPVPTQPVSVCIALADKLDTLISMFAIGEKPTGSKDPFALRRAALGVIRIVLENNIRLPLKPLFGCAPMHAIALQKAHDKLVKKTEVDLHNPAKIGKYLTVNETACEEIPEGATAILVSALFEFFIDRLKVQLKDQGIRRDVIAAVVADGDDDLVRVVARAKALQEFLGTEDGMNLLAAYKRAANILAIEEKKDKKDYTSAYKTFGANAQGVTYVLSAEEDKFTSTYGIVFPKIRIALENESFIEAMDHAATMRKPVDAFFDKVLINDENPDIRVNRLYMLSQLRTMLNTIANFALIEG